MYYETDFISNSHWTRRPQIWIWKKTTKKQKTKQNKTKQNKTKKKKKTEFGLKTENSCLIYNYNLFQRPWDFWPNFRSICWMKWETRFSRLNLIIRLIFPVGKKGLIRKENIVLCRAYYKFTIFFFSQLSTNISYKPYLILRHQLLCSPNMAMVWKNSTNT